MKQPIITNIQKYSIHDGEGIRTTIFFKGCPLSCEWCHNPETQKYHKTVLYYEERCTGCGACVKECEESAIRMEGPAVITDRNTCTACGNCTDACINNARELCGTTYEIQKLVEEVLKDRAFYETSGGGATLSGGEVLAQDPDYIETLMQRLTARGIKVNIDTCGAVPFERIERILPYTDTFLYDVKLLDEEKHIKYTGSSNRQILDNLKELSRRGAGIYIRIPVIGGVNDNEEEMRQIGRFLKENHIQYKQINLLPYHNTGSSKYQQLDWKYEGEEFYVPSKEQMEAFRKILEQEGAGPVKIGG